jgi:hypothetical protein
MKTTDTRIFLFFAGIKSPPEIDTCIIGCLGRSSTPPFIPFCDQHFYTDAHACICIGDCP